MRSVYDCACGGFKTRLKILAALPFTTCFPPLEMGSSLQLHSGEQNVAAVTLHDF